MIGKTDSIVVDETAPYIGRVISFHDPIPQQARWSHNFPTLPALGQSLTMSTVPVTAPFPRPTSARPQTAASSRPEGHSIVALLEGRGISREIGIATLNPETGRATIVQVPIYAPSDKTHPSHSKFRQLSDLPTYVKTLHQMHIHYPSLVLVPDTFISPHSSSDAKTSLLIDCIEDEFEGVPIEPVKRKYWNETAGGPSDRG